MDAIRHMTHVEDVRRDYAEDEIREKGQTIAKLLQDAARLETPDYHSPEEPTE